MFGLMMALTPTVLAQAIGVTSRLAAGAVPFAVFMSAAVAQVLTVRLGLRRQLLLSWIFMGAGIALLAVAVALGALAPFVIRGDLVLVLISVATPRRVIGDGATSSRHARPC
ncbi:hypothetical protein GCM10023065_28470 [Microbacterium laevaniformans]|uniref:hypothetical protein n=1 Tax=Microbacterium laevaniformans TaxID=36807 RepID=UPI001D420343|nr:hypothetical protein [Microbacterium laevaniformans]MBM7753810.1 hypothetical protein [Microbacterium laevaniformans]GLJ64365.1 hypothetical protein GCM10017578_12530 [Microbacterium laevaniformans]